MATDAENLATIRSNLLAYIATESANPKPSYSIDGQSVSWADHMASLWRQLESLNEQIAAAGGPFEVVEEAIT